MPKTHPLEALSGHGYLTLQEFGLGARCRTPADSGGSLWKLGFSEAAADAVPTHEDNEREYWAGHYWGVRARNK